MKGSIKLAIAAAAAIVTVAPVMAQEAEAPPTGPIEIIRATDAAMTCAAVSEEAARLREELAALEADPRR